MAELAGLAPTGGGSERGANDHIPLELLRAYSRAEISRGNMARAMGEDVPCGDVLAGLHAHGLKLPRYAAHPGSPGVEIIRRLATLAATDD